MIDEKKLQQFINVHRELSDESYERAEKSDDVSLIEQEKAISDTLDLFELWIKESKKD
jgi:hypothetical protein